jgi:hypothetical protein
MGDAPFFDYSAKRGYQNTKKPPNTPGIHSFIQQLHLQNSFMQQIIWRTPNSFKDSNVSPSERQRKKEESGRAP